MMQLSHLLGDKTWLTQPVVRNCIWSVWIRVCGWLTQHAKSSIVVAEERKRSQHMWLKCAVVTYSSIS